jgi:hypothetical protein
MLGNVKMYTCSFVQIISPQTKTIWINIILLSVFCLHGLGNKPSTKMFIGLCLYVYVCRHVYENMCHIHMLWLAYFCINIRWMYQACLTFALYKWICYDCKPNLSHFCDVVTHNRSRTVWTTCMTTVLNSKWVELNESIDSWMLL